MNHLEILIPGDPKNEQYRSQLEAEGIQGGWNYSLDQSWLWRQIAEYFDETQPRWPVILDVGCGNSMLHPFLERQLNLGIIGIDRIEGTCPHTPGRTPIMDICAEFGDVYTRFEGMCDVVYWCSSIEHNPVRQQVHAVDRSMFCLKPGGLFLATFAVSRETGYFAPSDQWNLQVKAAEAVYSAPWSTPWAFDRIVEEYRKDTVMDARHHKRYGTEDYAFVVAGARKVKP